MGEHQKSEAEIEGEAMAAALIIPGLFFGGLFMAISVVGAIWQWFVLHVVVRGIYVFSNVLEVKFAPLAKPFEWLSHQVGGGFKGTVVVFSLAVVLAAMIGRWILKSEQKSNQWNDLPSRR